MMHVWEFLDKPNIIEEAVRMPPVEKTGGLEACAVWFMAKYGEGLQANMKPAFHTYYYNGRHFFRIWCQSQNGGWVDLSHSIHVIYSNSGLTTYEIPEGFVDYKRGYWNGRTRMTSMSEVLLFEKILTSVPGLEHLSEKIE